MQMYGVHNTVEKVEKETMDAKWKSYTPLIGISSDNWITLISGSSSPSASRTTNTHSN